MNEDAHIGEIASALVLLAAIATTFTTYSYYKDDEVATQYESDAVSLDQTASALMSLRISEQALAAQSTSTTATTSAKKLKN